MKLVKFDRVELVRPQASYDYHSQVIVVQEDRVLLEITQTAERRLFLIADITESVTGGFRVELSKAL